MPGKWQNNITPYLSEIMDTFNDSNIDEVIIVKPTQIGGTEVINNIIGYIISESPSPVMIVYPTDDLVKRSSENRLKPMIKESPILKGKFNERKSKIKELKFTGSTIYLATAGSISDIASTPIKHLFIDEEDKITTDFTSEGDTVELAIERTKTYSNQGSKVYRVSTPTTKHGRIWKAMENADVIKKATVMCPECKDYIELNFKNLKWSFNETKTDVKEVYYVCDECGGYIDETFQHTLLKSVKWKISKRNRERSAKIAYLINTLYSPFVTWKQIAEKFLESKEDPALLQNFVNSWLGEPWIESNAEVEEIVFENSQSKEERYIVPEWAEILTGGVDVQKTSLYFTIKAWGPRLTSQTIHHGHVLSFLDIEEIMNATYKKEDDSEYIVSLCAVDSGDRTDEVYEFCLMNSEWAVAVKGASTTLAGYYRVSTVNKENSNANGTPLINVDTNKYKDMIMSRYNRENGQGSFMLYQNCEKEYIKQLASERKITNKRTGKTNWIAKSRRDNHYLDTEVYAGVAADLVGVRDMHLYMEE